MFDFSSLKWKLLAGKALKLTVCGRNLCTLFSNLSDSINTEVKAPKNKYAQEDKHTSQTDT